MPIVKCVTCGDVAVNLVRRDCQINRGGMSLCARCTPSKGVWVLRYDDGATGEKISGSVARIMVKKSR
jgi:hypothetical protein